MVIAQPYFTQTYVASLLDLLTKVSRTPWMLVAGRLGEVTEEELAYDSANV